MMKQGWIGGNIQFVLARRALFFQKFLFFEQILEILKQ